MLGTVDNKQIPLGGSPLSVCRFRVCATAVKSDAEEIIVGAGLAGLATARHLSAAGVSAKVCEASDDVGGRVRTDLVD